MKKRGKLTQNTTPEITSNMYRYIGHKGDIEGRHPEAQNKYEKQLSHL